MSSARKTREKQKPRRGISRQSLLKDMRSIDVDYCVNSPLWVVSVVKDAITLLKSKGKVCPGCGSTDPDNIHTAKCKYV